MTIVWPMPGSARRCCPVSAEERDAAVYVLGMAAARLDPNQRARAEGLAREIAVSIVTGQARTRTASLPKRCRARRCETRASLSSFPSSRDGTRSVDNLNRDAKQVPAPRSVRM